MREFVPKISVHNIFSRKYAHSIYTDTFLIWDGKKQICLSHDIGMCWMMMEYCNTFIFP